MSFESHDPVDGRLGADGRFEVRGHLGSGTSGDVYRVYDRKRRSEVALKTLHKTDPAAIFRFKQEFRALADVDHPNLVRLYELLSEGERWFFTMELVEGLDFIEYVRGGPAAGEGLEDAPTLELGGRSERRRLRQALLQLAEGLVALHRAGKLHCDIKPSNLRVTSEGRVVLLDFGLVKELFSPQIYETLAGDVTGTPAYMSPEQAAGSRVSGASDWYSVGVVLYEALAGSVPYDGGFLKILTDKQRRDPTPLSQAAPGAPEDLAELCHRLLARDPEKRPSGQRVLEHLGAPKPAPGERRPGLAASSSATASFIGRSQHLGELDRAFELTCQGRTAVVFLHGSSGMGKSELVRHFLYALRARRDDAVLLAGRCYERESVPYKGFDSLIDALSRYLRQLPSREAEILMPTNVLALARLFPALRRVQAVAGAQRRVLDIPDSREQRRRAFAALRELLGRLADRAPLVLHIDDLQWGDLDSGALLAEILRPPDPPALLLVACYRSEERETSPVLRALFHDGLLTDAVFARELELRELPLDEARDLALELLGEKGSAAMALAEKIALESEGNPFFIDELVRYSKTEAGLDSEGERSFSAELELAMARHMSLENLIKARLGRLAPESRRLLEVVAVAGRPVDLEAARQAAELGRETQTAVVALRGASLVRLRRGPESEEIEAYHDRISAAVLAALEGAELRRLHRRLAVALEGSGRADPETLAIHFGEAGERERAARFAAAAAEEAAEALAFDRAARLYRLALDVEVHEAGHRRRLRVELGNALSNAGRGAEAARVYLDASVGAKAARALELRRRAAEQLLISGHVDEGLATVETVLESVGMRLAKTPKRAVVSLLWQLLRLKLRGLDFEERDSTQIAADHLIRIDTCWSVSIGLGTVDTVRGMEFGKRHLLLALEAGEPYRVARALAIEAAYSATGGNKATARTERLVRASMTLAERVNHPHALGLAHLTAGMAAYLAGKWRKALELLERGETLLRENCTGVTWELDTAIAYQLRALLFIGGLKEIADRLPRYLKDVREKGDLYAETNLRSRVVWVALLAADRPEEALEEVEGAIRRWSQEGFHLQHYWHLTGQIEIALYRGDAEAAWAALEAGWPKMERSMLLRIQLTRTEARHTRCRGALAMAAADPASSGKLLREIEADLRRIEREKISWAEPLVQALRAGIATLEGRRTDALERLVAAAAGFEAADMELYAAASRYRRGQILGGEGGENLQAEAEAWIAGQGVRDPGRFCDVLLPGVWGESRDERI